MSTNPSPEFAARLTETLSASPRPVTIEALVRSICGAQPPTATTHRTIEQALHNIYQAVPVGRNQYGWLSNLLAGTTYCHPLSTSEIETGRMLLDELEHCVFFPEYFQDHLHKLRTVEISLFGADTVQAGLVARRNVWMLDLGEPYVQWLFDLGVERRDDLLIRVVDARAGRYELRARLRELRDEKAIEARNIRMAMLAEELVAEDSRTRDFMPAWDLAARLIGRGFFNDPLPPKDLHYVLSEYCMLRMVKGAGFQLDAEAAAAIYGSQSNAETRGQDYGAADVPAAWSQPISDSTAHADGPLQRHESYGTQSEMEGESGMDDESGMDGEIELDDEICPAYQDYLDKYEEDPGDFVQLQHDEFHLLEAELDMLIQLEVEFDGLLPEQEARKSVLAGRLYIDPETLADMIWETPDDPYEEDPPFWLN
ncbi:MAG: hypothetical protein ACK2UO_13945 [Caldilineaceae bacterium]